MANNIKGITIELGGNTGPLTTALKGVDSTSRNLQNELKEVNRQLKFDPKNTTLLTQKMDLLKQNTQMLEEKQKTLKIAVEQAHTQFEKGDLGADKVRAVEREYEKVNSQLRNSKKELNEVEVTAGTFTEKVKARFVSLKDSIKSAFTWDNIKTTIGAAGMAVGSFLGVSVKEAAEAGNAQANLAQTLKSTKGAAGMTAESLEKLSETLSKNTTFEDDEVKSGEAMLLTFTKIGKDVFPMASSAMLDYAQKMGVDAKSAAMTLGKALNDPTTGLSKLTKSGVTFTAQQKAQITAMQKAGDTAGAQKLMIAELNKEFGGQASAAADTFAGKQKQLANSLKEVKESIGTALLPILAQLGGYLVKILKPIAQFISAHPKISAGILAIIAVVGTLIGGMSALNSVLGLLGITLKANQLLMAGGVMAAIIAIAAGAALIITHWSQIKTFFAGLWSSIKSGVVGVGTSIKSAFTGAVSNVKSVWNGIGSFFTSLWNGVKTTTTNIWNGIKTFFITVWTGIKTAVMAIVTPFVNGITNIWNSMSTGVATILTGLKNVIKGIWEAIKTVVMGPVLLILDLVTGNFTKLSTDAQTIFNNLKTAFSTIWNGIKQIFAGAVQAIAGFLKVEWDGMVVAAKTIWNGFKTFIPALWNGIKSITTSAWNGIKTGLSSLWNGIVNTGKSVFNGFKSFFTSLWNGLVSFITGLPGKFASGVQGIGNAIIHGFDSAIDFIKNLPSKMLQWGKDMIQGLVDGIKSMIDKVGDAASGVAEKIRSFLHFSKPDVGPLSDADKYGADFMKLLAKTIEDNADKPANATKKVADLVSQRVQNIKDNLNKQTKSLNAQLKSETAKLNAELAKVGNAETGALRGVKGNKRYGIEDKYNTEKKTIKNEIALKKEQTEKAITLRKSQADKEITEIQKIGKMSKDELDTEIQNRKDAVSDINDLFSKLKESLKGYYSDAEKAEENSINKQISDNTKWKDNALDNLEKVYNAKKDELSKEETELDRSDNDEDDSGKEAELRKQLNMHYGAEKKKELTDELNDLIKTRNRRHQKETLEDQKSALESQYNTDKANVEKTAQTNEDNYNKQLENVKNFYTEKQKEANIGAEAQKLIVSNNQTEIVSLLKSYGQDYEIAGADLGNRLASGLKNALSTIPSMIKGITSQISALDTNSVNVPSSLLNKNSSGIDTSSITNAVSQALISVKSSSSQQIIVPVYLNSKQIAEATASYSDKISGANIAFAQRGL